MSAWRINHESVSHDLMNAEVIAIHLGTGVYYSLRGTAAVIWQSLATPVDSAGIVQAMVTGFAVEPGRAASEVATFLQRLREEDLIVEDAFAGAVAVAPVAPGGPYASPELERFADLRDLLLLDPIHDVGAQGWPHRPPPEKGK
jgi:hypothetical protein